MTAELKKQLRPELDAIIRWLKAPPVAEHVSPTKQPNSTNEVDTSEVKPVKKTAIVSSTRKSQRAARQ